MLSPIVKLYVLFASKRMSTAEAFLGSMAVKFVELLNKNKDKINFPSTKNTGCRLWDNKLRFVYL